MTVANAEMAISVEKIVNRYQRDASMLVSILQDIQAKYNYLPRPALEEVSHCLNIAVSRVYSVGTFFKSFSLVPRGRHLINVCLGTACHVRGAARVMDTIERELGIKPGETTKDLKFSLERVNCIGACALGPVVVVDGENAGDMNSEKVKPLLQRYD